MLCVPKQSGLRLFCKNAPRTIIDLKTKPPPVFFENCEDGQQVATALEVGQRINEYSHHNCRFCRKPQVTKSRKITGTTISTLRHQTFEWPNSLKTLFIKAERGLRCRYHNFTFVSKKWLCGIVLLFGAWIFSRDNSQCTIPKKSNCAMCYTPWYTYIT